MSLAILEPLQTDKSESSKASGESWQDVARQNYTLMSAWLADMERDPDLARLSVGRHNYPWLQSTLARWILADRPEVAWPKPTKDHLEESRQSESFPTIHHRGE